MLNSCRWGPMIMGTCTSCSMVGLRHPSPSCVSTCLCICMRAQCMHARERAHVHTDERLIPDRNSQQVFPPSNNATEHVPRGRPAGGRQSDSREGHAPASRKHTRAPAAVVVLRPRSVSFSTHAPAGAPEGRSKAGPTRVYAPLTVAFTVVLRQPTPADNPLDDAKCLG